MRKASDSTLRLRKENQILKRANHTLTVDRQQEATRAQRAEASVKVWVALVDRLVAILAAPAVPKRGPSCEVMGMVGRWRDMARQADRLAAQHDSEHDGANSHAFRKERRIWTTCADELQALAAPAVSRDTERMRP